MAAENHSLDRLTMVRRKYLALMIAAAVAATACTAPRSRSTTTVPDGSAALVGRITAVVDGDTVDIEMADAGVERARLLGIDTPETVKPDAPVDCFGPEASARTKELLPAGTEVLVQRDQQARDRYGRLLVYLWRSSDGLFVNEALVADGFARTLSIAPNNAHRADLNQAQSRARADGAGLWGACPPSS